MKWNSLLLLLASVALPVLGAEDPNRALRALTTVEEEKTLTPPAEEKEEKQDEKTEEEKIGEEKKEAEEKEGEEKDGEKENGETEVENEAEKEDPTFFMVLYEGFGYIMVVAWGISFYPQISMNWKRKSTQGIII